MTPKGLNYTAYAFVRFCVRTKVEFFCCSRETLSIRTYAFLAYNGYYTILASNLKCTRFSADKNVWCAFTAFPILRF